MDEYTANQIELSALLDLVPYCDNAAVGCSGMTLVELADQIEKAYKESGKKPSEEFLMFKAMLNAHPEWKGVTLVNQSSNSTGAWTDDLIQACTFVDSDGNYYVVYRGTGEGRWPDNGDGMTEQSTEMQRAAADYFDEIAEKYLLEAHANGNKVFVSGHSKGGNEAQYVYMAAKYEYLIDNCYSLDGQGFSEKAIDSFKARYGDRYEEKLSRMYSICGQDDYVHDLGIVIIPEGNTYYTNSSGFGMKAWHAIPYMLGYYNEKTGEWIYTGIGWAKEDGKIVNGEQGPVGKFTKKLSEFMMNLDPEDRHGAAVYMMMLVDRAMNIGDKNWGIIGGVEVTFWDRIDFLAHGIPTVFAALLLTPEGYQLIGSIIVSLVKEAYEEHGIIGAVGAALGIGLILFVGGVVLSKIWKTVAELVIISNLIDWVFDSIIDLIAFSETAIGYITQIWAAVVDAIHNLFSWITNKNAGNQYATENPQIKVDTALLRGLAERINKVNGRISKIDGRLDSLYWRVGLLDLWRILQADLLTSYSWRLLRCSGYLNDTAREFESVERNLMEVN